MQDLVVLGVLVLQVGACLIALAGVSVFVRQAVSRVSGRPPAAWEVIVSTLAVIGLAGLLMFWLAFFGLWLAFAFKLSFWLLASGIIAWSIRTKGISSLVQEEHKAFLLTLVPVPFLLLLLFSGEASLLLSDTGYTLRHAATAWGTHRPGDNAIPYDFAIALRNAFIPSPLHGDWLSSDRPPLQTGMYLLLDLSPVASPLSYQVTSSMLQALCIPACYSLVRALGGAKQRAIFASMLFAFAPFFILNFIYVWPKFLAASFLISAMALYFRRTEDDQKFPIAFYGIGGTLVALAMLSHGASAFAVLGFGPIVLFLRRTGNYKAIMLAAVCAVGTYLPWLGYQTAFDPPGNRLAKWHLADVVDIDDRSTGQAISDAYSDLTFEDWTNGRARNLKAFVKPAPPGDLLKWMTENNGAERQNRYDRLLGQAFFKYGAALGILQIALFGIPLFVLLSREARAIGLSVIASSVIAALFILKPGGTIPHQTSYMLYPALAAMVSLPFPNNFVYRTALIAAMFIQAAVSLMMLSSF